MHHVVNGFPTQFSYSWQTHILAHFNKPKWPYQGAHGIHLLPIRPLILPRLTALKARGPIHAVCLVPFRFHLWSPVAWKGGVSLTKHYTQHHYQTKTLFCIECRKIFFTPFIVLCREAHWPGTSLLSTKPLASEEDSEKIIQPTINLKNGGATKGTDYAVASLGHSFARWPVFPQV